MIAIRICRRCRKEFEAEVGVDRNIYCEKCRDLMSFIEDEEKYQDEENLPTIQEGLSAVDDALLAGIQKTFRHIQSRAWISTAAVLSEVRPQRKHHQ